MKIILPCREYRIDWFSMRNAQVSIEAMVLISVLLIALLGSIIIITQKLAISKPIIDNSKNFADCQKIAETIAFVQSAEAVTDQNITVDNDLNIIKNNIIIGETSCYYFGKVEGDATGVLLSRGTIKISKDAGGKVHASNP